MPKRGRGGYYLYGQPVAKRFRQGLGLALRGAGAAARYYLTRTKNKSRGAIATSEKDLRNTYRYKRMPRRRKRAWRRKIRVQRAISQKDLGTQNQIFNSLWLRDSEETKQNWTDFSLYSFKGGAGSGVAPPHDDMWQIVQNLNGTSPSTIQQKITFKSAVLDCTITNVGFETAEIELYYYYVTKRTDNYASPNSLAANMITKSEQINSTSSTVGTNLVGTTPFDCPGLGRYMKIYKTTRIYLGAGNSTFVMLRDPKNHFLNTESVITESAGTCFGERRWTQGCIVVFRGANKLVGAPLNPVVAPVSLAFNCQRKYHWVSDEAAIPATGYN